MSPGATYTSTYIRTHVRPLFSTLALTAFISTLLLIVVGSTVRVTGYGLGCPDWPLCYGQVIPPPKLGAWVEFTHRLVGAVTSLQIVLLGLLAWREYRHEKWIFRPAILAVGLLVAQIFLGGIHVMFELPLSTGWIHTGVAMAIVGLVAVLVATTHPAARSLSSRMSRRLQNTSLPIWLAITTGATYLLILTGSYVTRTGASLICPAFPYCGLNVTPALQRLVTIQMLHRYAAIIVAFGIVLTLWHLLRAARNDRGVRRVVFVMAALIAIQFGLGISNVLLRLPMWSRALHLLVAAIIWSAMVMLWVMVRREGNTPAS